MAKHKPKVRKLPKPAPSFLGTGMARKAVEALRKKERKRRKLLGM